MRADLHLHTVYSDGAFTPQELAARAAAAGVEFLSMTDHDNMSGMAEKAAAAASCGLRFVPGWEVSSYEGGKVHVLGYRCAAGPAYEAFLEERRRGGTLRARDMVEKANACLGLDVTMSEVERFHLKKETPLHTMHVVRAFSVRLKRKLKEVYAAYFDKGMPAYSDLFRPSPSEAIRVIHALGGIAVLAHPGRIALPFCEREALIARLCAEGLDGIECVYTAHTAEETEYFLRIAERCGLLVTGGSDFHADGGRRVLGMPAFYPSDRLLSALLD